MTEFLISLSGMLRPSFAAIKARGYPVAFEARAEDRDKRALTYREHVSNRHNTKLPSTDFDYAVFLRDRVKRILNVAFTNDTKMTDDVNCSCTKHVIICIRKCLRGGDNDRVSRMDTKRVKVLKKI